jgi:hypothetical protein
MLRGGDSHHLALPPAFVLLLVASATAALGAARGTVAAARPCSGAACDYATARGEGHLTICHLQREARPVLLASDDGGARIDDAVGRSWSLTDNDLEELKGCVGLFQSNRSLPLQYI